MVRNKKERIRKGNLFIPLIFSFGAILEGLSTREFLQDPTKLSNCLRTIQNYFKVDGVVCYGDMTLLAEALGCVISSGPYPPAVKPLRELPMDSENWLKGMVGRGRVPTAIEVIKRLNVLLPDSLLLTVIPGPVTLACQLTGMLATDVLNRNDLLEISAKASLLLTKAMGDAGVDLLMIREKTLPLSDEVGIKKLSRCFAPLWNTAKFYDLSPLLVIEDLKAEKFDLASKLSGSFVIPADQLSISAPKGRKVSLSLPVALLEKEAGQIESFLLSKLVIAGSAPPPLFLLTTDGEIPSEMNREKMIRGIQTARDFLKNLAS
jgi:hypothetical protein